MPGCVSSNQSEAIENIYPGKLWTEKSTALGLWQVVSTCGASLAPNVTILGPAASQSSDGKSLTNEEKCLVYLATVCCFDILWFVLSVWNARNETQKLSEAYRYLVTPHLSYNQDQVNFREIINCWLLLYLVWWGSWWERTLSIKQIFLILVQLSCGLVTPHSKLPVRP